MKKIRVPLKDRSYDILIGDGLLKKSGTILRSLDIGLDAYIITNGTLRKLYGKALERSIETSGLTAKFETVPDSEKAKSANVALRIIDRLIAYDKRRRLFIIAFGGGVIGDLAGFVAAAYKRGVPYAQIPTTLLAQVDSAIGGKVAIDLPIAKNLIGAFHQPKIVISDISLLGSLSQRELRTGLAEVIKYGVIKDARLFRFIEENYKKILGLDKKALEFIISRSSGIKAGVVEADEFDKKGLRAILNYGHTLGHAIEAAAHYSKKYNHGEAVAIGMVLASEISIRLHLIKKEEAARVKNLLRAVGLPTRISAVKFNDIRASYIHDKKFIRGENRLILPTRIGRVRVVNNVPDPVIRDVIKDSLA